MSFRSEDPLFSAYNGQYIEMLVNGVRKKFFVEKTNNFSLLSGTNYLNPNIYDYSFIKVSDEQTCDKKCLESGTSVRMIYSRNSVYKNIPNPCPQPHNCNAARYLFYINDIFIGNVNLDNYPTGADKENEFILTAGQVNDIKLVNDKIFTFKLVCNVADNPPIGTNGSLGPGICHDSPPWFYISTNGGSVLYSGCPSSNEFTIELMCV